MNIRRNSLMKSLGSISITGSHRKSSSATLESLSLEPISKSGYLIKLAHKSGRNWKRRYFVLCENSLKYYVDHASTDYPKGEIILNADSSVAEVDRKVLGRGYGLIINIQQGISPLTIAAKDEEDKKAWKDALEAAISNIRSSVKGYGYKIEVSEGDTKIKKYFRLNDDILTYYQDHNSSGIQGVTKLGGECVISVNEKLYRISITEPNARNSIILEFTSVDFDVWVKALLFSCDKTADGNAVDARRVQEALANSIKQGQLRVRPPKGGDVWEDRYFVLTWNEMMVLENMNSKKLLETFRIYPSCSVFETNLGPFAFELVTSEKVLHVMSESKELTSEWMVILRNAIFRSQPEPNDPLLQAALKKIELDVHYEVVFREDKPLGVVLERTGEWAVVKLSNPVDTGVYIGSALTAINNSSVILLSYQQTIEKLRNWRPPLQLGFLRAPSKVGYLVKQARNNRSSGVKKSWKQRYFVLDEGRLMYKENESNTAALKGDVPLMGSAVSLVSEIETGKAYCFRLVSGVTCLIMHALSAEDMMDWAATLYHAIAIANGGAHLLAMEREKQARLTAEVEKARLAKESAERLEQQEIENERLAKEMAELKEKHERDAKADAEARVAQIMEENERQKLQQQYFVADEQVLPPPPPEGESQSQSESSDAVADTEQPLQTTDDQVVVVVEEEDVAVEVAVESDAPEVNEAEAEVVAVEESKGGDVEEVEVVAVEVVDEVQLPPADVTIQMEPTTRLEIVDVNKDSVTVTRSEAADGVVLDNVLSVEEETVVPFSIVSASKDRLPRDEPGEAEGMELRLTKDMAEVQLATAIATAISGGSLRTHTQKVDALMQAIEAAKWAGADSAKVQASLELLAKLKSEKVARDEAIRILKFAVMYKSYNGLSEALVIAEAAGLSDDPLYQDAKILFTKMYEERKKLKADQDARLAKEAAELDAQLELEERDGEEEEGDDIINKNTTTEDEDDNEYAMNMSMSMIPKLNFSAEVELETDDIDEDDIPAPAAASSTAKAKTWNQNRNSTKKYTLEKRHEEIIDESLPSLDSVLDEDIIKVFDAFGKRVHSGSSSVSVSGSKDKDKEKAEAAGGQEEAAEGEAAEEQEITLSVIQFSTIWRLLTGDKSNLFKEMQIFHKFDANNNGFLSASEFVEGWRRLASQPGGERLIRKIKTLSGADNVIL